MAFYINKINRKQIKNIDDEIKTSLEMDAKKVKKEEDSEVPFSKNEYLQMLDKGLFDKGVPLVQMKCTKCGRVKEGTKTSTMYYNKVCANCMRKLKAGKGRIIL